MIELRISSRYAKSLLDAARDNGMMDAVSEDVRSFISLGKQNRDLLNILRSPVIAKEIKYRIVERLFKAHYQDLTFRFINLVIRKNREALFRDIFERFLELYNIEHKISYASIYSAAPVDEKLLEKAKEMVAQYTDTTVHLDNQINSKLIGGFILRFADRKYDASIASQLNLLKQELAN